MDPTKLQAIKDAIVDFQAKSAAKDEADVTSAEADNFAIGKEAEATAARANSDVLANEAVDAADALDASVQALEDAINAFQEG